MSKSLGRLVFIGFIWIYSFFYYLECRELGDPSERMTIAAVFRIFTAFVIWEAVVRVRQVLEEKRNQSICPSIEIVRRFFRDEKLHLAGLIVLYLVALPYIGFYVTSFCAFCAFSFVLGTRGRIQTILPAVLVLTVIWLIFTFALKLPLPRGILI